ncbi:MAG: DUF3794 domain-containing protein [Syntrophomonadaceae bacterium]|nr:DUF3794 domain-containing protein [Syntrophomonadaceae bacterium]
MSEVLQVRPVCIRVPEVIGRQTTEVLLVDDITFTTPVFKIIDVLIDVEITDCFVCTDKVIFNGRMQKNIVYKAPRDPATGEGTVNYREFVRDFAGFVVIPGVLKDDECLVERAVVRQDCEVFIPTERDANGNIVAATEKVIIDVDIKVLRPRQITVNLASTDICPELEL